METITAIVETPKGSNAKYNYDEQHNGFKLKKLLPAGMVFPFDFGFIPSTRGGDGDPLDVIILSEIKSFPGCIMDCRLIGAITASQSAKGKTVRNDRLLAVPLASQLFETIRSINNLPKDIITQLESFFINYNKLEGKTFKPLKHIGAQQALKLIKTNIQ
ncbi:inorganic diphosphatase [Parafilimonas terrae]|uniref:inorganic diphosphatase n=1 Tax=Parafilimonas terrae TaxID=1465490 RepID=A0A1I5RUC3_9BACT|nr:inorganic diphosphatase [Parafilimonas terrae]SFP62159.1 inorganic pyrophosphatase [Parafilimonas terrae]